MKVGRCLSGLSGKKKNSGSFRSGPATFGLLFSSISGIR